MIHVCSLAALPETVRVTGASHILTVMANVDQVLRPASVLEANHLRVSMDDITEQMDGFVAPSVEHIERVLNFVRGWDRSAPMVVLRPPSPEVQPPITTSWIATFLTLIQCRNRPPR